MAKKKSEISEIENFRKMQVKKRIIHPKLKQKDKKSNYHEYC